jgi:hypothetical protein
MAYLLHVTNADGTVTTVPCASALIRGLWMISLATSPVTLRTEDRA